MVVGAGGRGTMGRGGWDSEALTDHRGKRTSMKQSCSLLQLEDLAGRSQQSGGSRGVRGSRGQNWAGGGGGGVSDAPLYVLSVHFIQQWRGVSGDGHGRALDHGAG